MVNEENLPAQAGLVEEMDRSVPVQGHCRIFHNLGWCKVSLDELIHQNELVYEQLQVCRQTLHEYKDRMDSSWFAQIHYYDRPSCMSLAVRLPEVMDAANLMIWKRHLTASAIIYDFALPEALWLLDDGTIDAILRYLAITEPVPVDVNNLDALRPYLSMPGHLDELVTALMHNQALIHAVFHQERPPNFVFTRLTLGFPMHLSGSFTPDQLRKAFTCIYLRARLYVPKDYLYVDLEVADYVNCVGEFDRNAPKG